MTLELSQKDIIILERVKKLLAIAQDERGNENQASAAAAKAQELLTQYNLDMAMVGGVSNEGGRTDTRFRGGLYKWQRDLWHSVARLNFCMYWYYKGHRKGAKYEHRLLGRKHNVVGAEVLADYLQSTIERFAQDTARGRDMNVFCREMIAFREGMARRLCERLEQLRRDKLYEEQEKQRAAKAGEPQGNGMGLVKLTQNEADLNMDHYMGYEPGTTARQRAEAIQREREREAEFQKWAEENPEEYEEHVRKEEEEQRKWDEKWRRQQRNRRRRWTAEDERRQMAEFDEGYDEGDNVSLNQQVNEGSGSPKQIN